MIEKTEIDKGFKYYNLDRKYIDRCYDCADIINNNVQYLELFNKMFMVLNYEDFDNIRPYWNIKNIDEIFGKDVDNFVTNLIIVLSYKNHEENINKYKLDNKQVLIHKKRVKECFQNDLEIRKYAGVRISQMLWAIYFIRVRLIEIGRLQYELFEEDDKKIIKLHIFSGEKLDYNKVIDSLNKSKQEIQKVFNVKDADYICKSWLLSNDLNKIISEDTNIKKFYKLFNVEDGEDCTLDILNFVYGLKECNNYNDLLERTSLQRIIKKELIAGSKLKNGIGVLKIN